MKKLIHFFLIALFLSIVLNMLPINAIGQQEMPLIENDIKIDSSKLSKIQNEEIIKIQHEELQKERNDAQKSRAYLITIFSVTVIIAIIFIVLSIIYITKYNRLKRCQNAKQSPTMSIF